VITQESELSWVPAFPGGQMPWTEITAASSGTCSVEMEGCGGVAGGPCLGGPGYCACDCKDPTARMQVIKTARIISKTFLSM
jgi:hypothetical protein